MFGYVVAPVDALSEQDNARYRAAYCGLCRAIGERHGQLARFSLTYDMTFLSLLLQSLYEPEEKSGENACIAHPIKRRPWSRSALTDYAADMTIALTWHKCHDDWNDDHKPHALAYAKLLEQSYYRCKEQWPRQCTMIEACMAEYTALEKQQAPGGDLCACFGRLMSELFVYQEDEWSPALRRLGHALGQFICLMDAAMDYQHDLKHKQYNALATLQLKPQDARETLMILMGQVTQIFEKLPLVQDIDLMRSILYSGIWQQYNAAMQKDKTQSGK